MSSYLVITIFVVVAISFMDFTIEMTKYSECRNLPPNKIKILEESKELRVWLGSEVSVTCCMKGSPSLPNNNKYYEDDIEISSSKNTGPLVWYGPKMNEIVNYFNDPQKAQQNGVFLIPDMLDKPKDIQVVHLIIKNYSISDNGVYKCDTNQNSHSPEGITIVGQPKIIIDAQEFQFLEEGKSGYIECRPRGHPNIDVVWFYEGQHISLDNHKFSFLQNHQVLRISKVTEEFAGKYLCKAEVSFADQIDAPPKGRFLEIQPIELIVYQTPTLSDDSPIIRSHPMSMDENQIAALEDGDLELACDSKGLPPPTITWYRDNKLINEKIDPRIKISESYYRRNAYSILKISPVQIQDIGVYMCNSSFSLHGFSISVAKNVTPEFVFLPRFLNLGTNLNASSLVGKNVVVNCSVFGTFPKRLNVSFIQHGFNNNINVYNEYSDKPSVKFEMKEDKHNLYISHYQLTILGIQPFDSGLYFCQASVKNSNGYTTSNIGTVSVLYGPKIIQTKTMKYGLWYKRNILKCEAKGYPNPVWEWKFQDLPLSKQYNQYRFKIINKNDTSISELTILPNYLNDAIFGTYQCNAENQFGTDSNVISFRQAWQPGPPNVNVCKVTASSIQLCVSPNEDSGGLPLTHYEMRIKDFEVNKVFGPFYYPVNPSTITLSHLKSNMTYNIALSSASEAGRGANTDVQVMTKPLGRPIVELVNTSAAPDYNAFNLRWVVDSDGGLPIVQYDVEIQQVEVDSESSRVINRIGKVKNYVIDDLSQFKHMFRVNSLDPNTWYELKFTAKNLMGPSVIQEVVFRTLEMPAALAGSQRLRDPFGSANNLKQPLIFNVLVVIIILMFQFK